MRKSRKGEKHGYMATAVHVENIPICSEMYMCLKYTVINVHVKSIFIYMWCIEWFWMEIFVLVCSQVNILLCDVKAAANWNCPRALVVCLEMINDWWHKHWEAQTEWDRWRRIEAEGEAQVKYPHIKIADAVDDRPLKPLLFHHNHLPKGL